MLNTSRQEESDLSIAIRKDQHSGQYQIAACRCPDAMGFVNEEHIQSKSFKNSQELRDYIQILDMELHSTHTLASAIC